MEGWLSRRKVGVLSAQMEMKTGKLSHGKSTWLIFTHLLGLRSVSCLEDIFPGPSSQTHSPLGTTSLVTPGMLHFHGGCFMKARLPARV